MARKGKLPEAKDLGYHPYQHIAMVKNNQDKSRISQKVECHFVPFPFVSRTKKVNKKPVWSWHKT